MDRIELYAEYVSLILDEYYELIKMLEGIDVCTKAYAVVDKNGRIKHFKGKPGVGERFKNCTLYFKCKGYDDQKAKGICGMIAARKCKANKSCSVRR